MRCDGDLAWNRYFVQSLYAPRFHPLIFGIIGFDRTRAAHEIFIGTLPGEDYPLFRCPAHREQLKIVTDGERIAHFCCGDHLPYGLFYRIFRYFTLNPRQTQYFRKFRSRRNIEGPVGSAGVTGDGTGIFLRQCGHQSGIHASGKCHRNILPFAGTADSFFYRPAEFFVFRHCIFPVCRGLTSIRTHDRCGSIRRKIPTGRFRILGSSVG